MALLDVPTMAPSVADTFVPEIVPVLVEMFPVLVEMFPVVVETFPVDTIELPVITPAFMVLAPAFSDPLESVMALPPSPTCRASL